MFLVVRNRHKDDDTGNRRNAKKDEDDGFLFQRCRQKCATQSGHYLYSSEGNVEEDRGEGIEAKRFDYQRTECGDATTRDSSTQLDSVCCSV